MASTQRVRPATIPAEAFDAILMEYPDTHTGLRAVAMLSLMRAVGLRVSEARHLRLDGYDPEDGRLEVPREGKTGERVVWLDPEGPTARVLGLWIARRPRYLRHKASPYLFCGKDGAPVSYQAINYAWLRGCDRAGYGRYRLHQLRHTAATEVLKAGADLPTVQAMLGHKSLVSTSVYLHPGSDELRTATKGR